MQEDSLFSTSSIASTIGRFFDDGHSAQCEVIPHCSFDLHFSDYKKEMATHSSILAWKTPWKEEPGKL